MYSFVHLLCVLIRVLFRDMSSTLMYFCNKILWFTRSKVFDKSSSRVPTISVLLISRHLKFLSKQLGMNN